MAALCDGACLFLFLQAGNLHFCQAPVWLETLERWHIWRVDCMDMVPTHQDRGPCLEMCWCHHLGLLQLSMVVQLSAGETFIR